MFQSGIPFHETGTFVSRRTFLPDAEYGVALDNLVKGCTDVLLVNPDGTRIFTGKRCVQPQPDWWFMGGRMFPGETPVGSCRRLLLRELGLDVIDPNRFVPVCAQAFAFGMREQEPKDHGTSDVQLCYKLRLIGEEEVAKVVLDPAEYCDGEWKTPNEILSGNYHPALRYAVGCMLASEALERLEEIEGGGGSDEEVANLSREFLRRRKDVDEIMKRGGANGYVLDSKESNYRTTVQSNY